MRLDAKAAIVTGAASGIGEGIARRFAEAGARVTVADRDGDGARRVAQAIIDGGAEALVVQCDVSREDDLQAMVEETAARFGGVDILVNNAGVIDFTPIETLTLARWEHVLAINLTSIAFASKHAVPHIRRAGGGAIVNIASIQAVLTGPKFAAYAASKGGVVTLTRSMALELGPMGIRVNAILPGYIRTPLFLADAERLGGGDPDVFVRELEQKIALGRIGTPADVAAVVLFAASDEARYVTGASLVVDAGATVQL
ncbi:MAG: SDR family NAD(P)-dependent oxidoreductase [Actinomycetota bacterium]